MKSNIPNVLMLTLVLLLSACDKDDVAPKSPTTTDPEPYYFKFSFENQNNNYNVNFPQYLSIYADEAGGYQVGDISLEPSIGIRLDWNTKDTVSENDLLSLIGKTLYFDDTAIKPVIEFMPSLNADFWYSVDTPDHSFNIKITDITYLKKDTALNPVQTYVLKGTCNAILYEQNLSMRKSALTGGEFNFIISRRDL